MHFPGLEVVLCANLKPCFMIQVYPIDINKGKASPVVWTHLVLYKK